MPRGHSRVFTVVAFTDGRNDYLEQTLSTFAEAVWFPHRPHVILVDDMPDGRDTRRLGRIARQFGIDELILNRVNLGLLDSVMTGWSAVPPETEFVFHLENDFVFPTRIDVPQLASLLEEPAIVNVTLLRQPWYEDERRAGGLLYVRPERFREAVVRGTRVSLHRDYFGFNPGLYRRDAIRHLTGPPGESHVVPWLELMMRDQLLAEDPSREFAICGWQGDPPAVLHIGHRRVGLSPDHGGPGDLRSRERGDTSPRVSLPASGRSHAVAPRRSDAPIVLLYHRVAALDPDPSELCVPPEIFREQMEDLVRRWEPVPMAVMVEGLASGCPPPGTVVITLDDGYADAMTASDILDDMSIPATFFVTSCGGELIHDTIVRVILEAAELPERLDLTRFSPGLWVDTEDRLRAFHAINDVAWRLTASDRQRLVELLASWASLDLPARNNRRLLTPLETRELAGRPGQQIGAHTVNHLMLTAHHQSVRHEILENLEYLRWLTGEPIRHLAYPYGAFDDETLAVCRGLGIEAAVTTVARPVTSADDRLQIPRLEVRGHTLPV